MTPRMRVIDRLATLVVGLGLVALALAAFDWRFGVVGRYQDTLPTGPAADVLASGWWPWAFAAAGIVLALVGLVWLLAHLRRPGPGEERLDASDETGRLEVDLRSVASAVAGRFAELAPVTGSSGTTEKRGRHTLVLVRAHVDPTSDAELIRSAAATCTREVAAAFPEDDVRLRILLDEPRKRRLPAGGGKDRVRVQ